MNRNVNSEEGLHSCGYHDGKRATQPAQEPVAWRTFDGESRYDYRAYEDNENYADDWEKRNPNHKGWVDKLYTTPPQREPLTDEAVLDIADYYLYNGGKTYGVLEFARAIEAAHGIKEKNT